MTFSVIEILLFIKQCPLKFMSGNWWWLTKFGAKVPSDLVIFSDIQLDFQELIRVVLLKNLMYFLAGINTK